MKNNKSWFTLAEIMIVITIMSILSLMATNFDFNKKSSREKMDRFVNKVISTIDTEKINIKIWRWIKSWTSIINPDFTKISISSWSINIKYYTGSNINSLNLLWTWSEIKYPYFWENLYTIKSIDFFSSSETLLNTSSSWKTLEIFLAPDNITLSWSTISGTSYSSTFVKFKIKLWYQPNFKTIEFDKRTWKIEIGTWITN
ncbi:MAG: hypothetical protein ACD_49C00076G0009 [uncultured bacterium (gcode 4)]|uniref:Prepilin-type N-terminal cleavage/methylation domain-containing protein n=1 Tax=uncultured bacterium (gcode 4) TaxID=1234023 RepID=K2BAX1_9BACT|nr:MAG: hypothetical protein ACD_49C00076G0009 [uncultured bacterium (gcode 4)]